MNIICFWTVHPSKQFYDFAKQLQNDEYKVYICIDDYDYNIPDYDYKVEIIKVDKDECIKNGYSRLIKNCICSSKDKSLYYFSKKNINYDYIWFLEEDVFIPNLNTLYHIDLQYNHKYDLLLPINFNDSKYITDNTLSIKNWNMGKRVKKCFYLIKKIQKRRRRRNKKKSKYQSIFNQTLFKHNMTCGLRISKNYMDIIYQFAKQHKSLFTDEVFFYSIADFHHLKIAFPDELKNIVYRKSWGIKHIEKGVIQSKNLYHPIKSIGKQYELRKILSESKTLEKF